MNFAQPGPARAVLSLRDVQRTFNQGSRSVSVLSGTSADIMAGEAVALVGPSGSGKSTLLQIAGLLEKPDSGHVIVHGRDCAQFGDAERTAVRRNTMGFVYQFHQLLPEFSALENVVIPQMIQGRSKRSAVARAKDLLAAMGLEKRFDHRPPELSGGEQQRTAICRALANEPSLLLADEPTGNLDPKTSERVFAALMGLVAQSGVSALIATHNLELATRMTRTLRMADGQLVDITRQA
ncbi:MAG: ABC transporter ATP-binding protein [Pseudomonadota bacterium]